MVAAESALKSTDLKFDLSYQRASECVSELVCVCEYSEWYQCESEQSEIDR